MDGLTPEDDWNIYQQEMVTGDDNQLCSRREAWLWVELTENIQVKKQPDSSVIKLLFYGTSFHLQSGRQTQSPHLRVD